MFPVTVLLKVDGKCLLGAPEGSLMRVANTKLLLYHACSTKEYSLWTEHVMEFP